MNVHDYPNYESHITGHEWKKSKVSPPSSLNFAGCFSNGESVSMRMLITLWLRMMMLRMLFVNTKCKSSFKPMVCEHKEYFSFSSLTIGIWMHRHSCLMGKH